MPFPHEARWRSGYVEDCKSSHAGSIPARASTRILGLRSPALFYGMWRASAPFAGKAFFKDGVPPHEFGASACLSPARRSPGQFARTFAESSGLERPTSRRSGPLAASRFRTLVHEALGGILIQGGDTHQRMHDKRPAVAADNHKTQRLAICGASSDAAPDEAGNVTVLPSLRMPVASQGVHRGPRWQGAQAPSRVQCARVAR